MTLVKKKSGGPTCVAQAKQYSAPTYQKAAKY